MVVIQEPKKGQFTITIPKSIMKHLGWKKGIELIAIPLNGDVILKKIKEKNFRIKKRKKIRK